MDLKNMTIEELEKELRHYVKLGYTWNNNMAGDIMDYIRMLDEKIGDREAKIESLLDDLKQAKARIKDRDSKIEGLIENLTNYIKVLDEKINNRDNTIKALTENLGDAQVKIEEAKGSFRISQEKRDPEKSIEKPVYYKRS